MKIKKSVHILDIGVISKRSGLPASTIRFYEEKGLIHSTGRHGLRRLFASQTIEQLKLIALGQQAGFSLEEIAAMFAASAADGQFQIDRKMLLSKADEVDKSIKQLVAVSDILRHVAKCSAPRHLECPKFQRLLYVAGRSRARVRKK